MDEDNRSLVLSHARVLFIGRPSVLIDVSDGTWPVQWPDRPGPYRGLDYRPPSWTRSRGRRRWSRAQPSGIGRAFAERFARTGHHSFLPHLTEHGDAHIVNTASMAGHWPGHSPYPAPKWAVVAMTEGLYQQLRMEGSTIGVSCLCPGFVATNIGHSERNRPDWAEPPAPRCPRDRRRHATDGARPPRRRHVAAAGRRADARCVVNSKFWIFTDMAMVRALEPRYQAILAADNPPTPTIR